MTCFIGSEAFAATGPACPPAGPAAAPAAAVPSPQEQWGANGYCQQSAPFQLRLRLQGVGVASDHQRQHGPISPGRGQPASVKALRQRSLR